MAHHVEHWTMANHGAEQIGTLRQGGADQQTAIAGARNRKLRRLRVSIGDEPIGGGDEVIEYVLLALAPTGLMPLLAEFAAAPEVG